MSEYHHVEKPFLDQLASLGWKIVDQGGGMIPSDAGASLRVNFREWLLPQVFCGAVRALNPWLTERQLEDLRSQILRQPNRTLLESNEEIQKLLFKAQVDLNEETGEADPVVKLIDFEHPERNAFHAINQFRIDTPGCVKDFIIPDIVLFVNGIPLVVVEAKVGNANTANPMHAAFEQLSRYRNGREDTKAAGLREGEPRLFHPNLLVIATCGDKAAYGSITSDYDHFHPWKDIWPEQFRDYAPPLGAERAQERLIQGMLPPETLLDILRSCAVFMDTDSGKRVKVVCRYQQYRAARKMLARLRVGQDADQRSGVVWHTQGSGKSLTMVFLARMIRASRDVSDFKIVMVNDRVDLEEQLTATAKLIGGKINVIASSAALRGQLGTEASDLNMVMVHKFMEREEELPTMVREALGSFAAPPSGKRFGIVNRSERILLMIDEAHRTQGSDLGDNVFEAFPNATRMAFTGTPLITEKHGHKRTVQRFGEYIDTYKLMDAVDDGATLQILYEGRTAETALRDKHGFDTKFEDLFRKRSYLEVEAIKRKYGASGDILEAEKRIGAIARDLVNHYVNNILPDGFKAQVVCHSKLAAIRYQKAIREALAERVERERWQAKPDHDLMRRVAFLKVAAVISSDATNELAVITEARKEAKRWNAVEHFCQPFDFEDRDKALTGIAFLVVCDMLLTGFDAPIEQVMYIDKRIKEHNLLQAIARVNRVAKGKQRGFIVDYIGLANHLTEALSIYNGEDADDLLKGLKNVNTELPILEERFRRLIQHFSACRVADIERFATEHITSREAEVKVIHEAVAAMRDIKRRADFEVYLKKFLQSLNLILPHPSGHRYRGPAKRFGYLLRMVKERYKDESLDIADAGAKVRALINEHLIDLGINPRIPPVELLSPDFMAQLHRHTDGNAEAKASEMEHAIRKHCTVHFDEDPAFYKKLSEKLEKLIQDHQDQWDLLAKGLEPLVYEAAAGRKAEGAGAAKEVRIFEDHIADLAFGGGGVPEAHRDRFAVLVSKLVETLRGTINILHFWDKFIEVKKLRGDIGTELQLCRIPELVQSHERIAVEVVKLAEKRHQELQS